MCRFNWYIIIQILCLILKSDSNLICFQLLKRLIELHQIVHQKPKTYFHILSEFWHHYCRSRSIFTFVKKIVFDHNFHNTVAKISVHPPPPRSFSLLSPPLIVVAYLWSGCPAVTHTHTQTHTHTVWCSVAVGVKPDLLQKPCQPFFNRSEWLLTTKMSWPQCSLFSPPLTVTQLLLTVQHER